MSTTRRNKQAAKATLGQTIYFALTGYEAQRKLGVKIEAPAYEIAQFARWIAQRIMESSAVVVSIGRDYPEAAREARIKAFDQLCYPELVVEITKRDLEE